MCLSSVWRGVRNPNRVDGIGFKVFNQLPDNKVAGNVQGGKYELGRWYRAPLHGKGPTFLRADNGQKYQPGFHVWLRDPEYNDNLGASTYLVAYRDIIACGPNFGPKGSANLTTIIARQIKILGLVRPPRPEPVGDPHP